MASNGKKSSRTNGDSGRADKSRSGQAGGGRGGSGKSRTSRSGTGTGSSRKGGPTSRGSGNAGRGKSSSERSGGGRGESDSGRNRGGSGADRTSARRRAGTKSSGDDRRKAAGKGRGAPRNVDGRSGSRSVSDDRQRPGSPPRGDFVFKGHELPKWVKEELRRTAKRGAGDAAIMALTKAAAHFAAGRHSQALSEARNAKRHAPQSPTVIETIGIAAYRSELWDEALRELKAFRRRTGEGTHLALEMDVLRALGRDADVEKTFALVRPAEMDAAARSEAKVVYASYLLDHGRPREAWAVAKPGKMGDSPSEAALRQWYVAARAAVAAGDLETATKIGQRIRKNDAAFPGLELLDQEISAAANTGP